jgi:VanZ family protein
MVMIFSLSSQVGDNSNNLSKGITIVIVNVIKKIAPNLNIDVDHLNNIFRKTAHFLIYLILGILMLYAFKVNFKISLKLTIIAIIICIAYAGSDEIHQIYIQGRGAHLTDVLIDSSGSIVGILLYSLARQLRLRH